MDRRNEEQKVHLRLYHGLGSPFHLVHECLF